MVSIRTPETYRENAATLAPESRQLFATKLALRFRYFIENQNMLSRAFYRILVKTLPTNVILTPAAQSEFNFLRFLAQLAG